MTAQDNFEQAAQKARRYLSKCDPKLAAVIRKYKTLPVLGKQTVFTALVNTIIGQQLSGLVATRIAKRVRALCPNGKITLPAIRKIKPAQLRKAGMSNAKVKSVGELIKHIDSGQLPIRRLHTMPDDEVMAAITSVWGLGPWSAQMLLMFTLGRTDIFSAGDYGIQTAIGKLYNLDPKKTDLDQFAERWRPYRTFACWYLWRSLENR